MYVRLTSQEKGTQNAQWWSSELESILGSGFARVALRQMSGLLVLVFVRRELMPHVGEVATASVACGVMGVGGNKGAVAVSMTVFRRRIVMVSSHFAAHQVRSERRLKGLGAWQGHLFSVWVVVKQEPSCVN